MLGLPEELFKKLQCTETIRALIGQPEDAHFDCKEWPARDDDAQKMLAKAACGLTNAEGGVLVIGMKAASKPKDEPDVVESAAPVSDTSVVKSRVLNLIGELVEPRIVGIDAIEVPERQNSTSGFVVVYVPTSVGSPRRSRKDWRFYQRIGSGTFPMEYFQMEERFGKRPPPKLELFLEGEEIKRSYHSPKQLIRCFVLGISNTGLGIAKFPSIRFKRACGLTNDPYGIDGCNGFGIPPHPSENEWCAFRGGVNEVIYPEETLKVTKLIQDHPEIRRDESWSAPRFMFRAFEFSCELSCEGTSTKAVEKIVSGREAEL